jgi:hypothetical protein
MKVDLGLSGARGFLDTRQVVSPVFALIVTGFLLVAIVLGGGTLSLSLMLALYAFILLSTLFGERALDLTGLAGLVARLPCALVIGIALFSLFAMLFAFVFGWTAWVCLGVSSVSLFVFAEVLASKLDSRKKVILSWADPWVTLIFAIAILALAKIPLSAPVVLAKTGVLPIWNDYYIHGITIASFGSEFALGSDMELVGAPRPFYHYLPFLPAAAFLTLSGLSPLGAATSMMLPLGLLVGVLGSYGLAVALGGRAGGFLSVAVLMSIPMAGLIVESGWFEPYWLLLITPGSGYAIAIAMLAFVALGQFFDTRRYRTLFFAGALLLLLIFTRAHFFLLAAPACVGLLILFKCRSKIKHLLWLSCTISVAAFGLLLFSSTLRARWLQFSNPAAYLSGALDGVLFLGAPLHLVSMPSGVRGLIELIVVLLASLGFTIVFLIAVHLKKGSLAFDGLGYLPLMLLLIYLLLILFAPAANNGDLTEYKHRHFVLLYFTFVVFLCTLPLQLYAKLIARTVALRQWLYCFSAVLLLSSIVHNHGKNPAAPALARMAWAESYHDQVVTPGVVSAAEYLRRHSAPGDVVAFETKSLGSQLNSLAVEVVALSGVPTFLSRPTLKLRSGPCIQNLVKKRSVVLGEIEKKSTWSDVATLLQSSGIRWYLIVNDSPESKELVDEIALKTGRINVLDSTFAQPAWLHFSDC